MQSIEVLRQRAEIICKIRSFFTTRDVMEVATPLLSPAGVTDLHLHSLTTKCFVPGELDPQTLYLQTSPEYAMKRLLAAGSGDIYQICKAFRDEECGKLHNPEFTMLEWYRLGFDHNDLMSEMDELLQCILQTPAGEYITYRDCFLKYCDIDPHHATSEQLIATLSNHNILLPSGIHGSQVTNTCLDLLMSHVIEPQLGFEQPTFIYDYPSSQAALAKIRFDEKHNVQLAERFEVYVRGVELANGYHELCDAAEQARRFAADLVARKTLGLPLPVIDKPLLAALESGLPDCAGVALGVDRLIMLACNADSIHA